MIGVENNLIICSNNSKFLPHSCSPTPLPQYWRAVPSVCWWLFVLSRSLQTTWASPSWRPAPRAPPTWSRPSWPWLPRSRRGWARGPRPAVRRSPTSRSRASPSTPPPGAAVEAPTTPSSEGRTPSQPGPAPQCPTHQQNPDPSNVPLLQTPRQRQETRPEPWPSPTSTTTRTTSRIPTVSNVTLLHRPPATRTTTRLTSPCSTGMAEGEWEGSSRMIADEGHVSRYRTGPSTVSPPAWRNTAALILLSLLCLSYSNAHPIWEVNKSAIF